MIIKTYSAIDERIGKIKIDKFPVVIFSDSHTNIVNIRRLQKLYPNSQLICLGDITFFPSTEGVWNKKSIDFFINHKIPCLVGNHDHFIAHEFLNEADWELEQYHVSFLRKLPLGFKLVLPDGSYYFDCRGGENRSIAKGL